MGRGRAKAKQTKVARELKYSSPSTDFASLQRELSGHSPRRSGVLSEEHNSDESLKRWEEDEDYDDWRR
ncbi:MULTISPECIES: DUF3073 domain-containing protein [Nocardia]|jgi:hypothetical protein|uniref:DUF3073 domain-containing protein n=1 Tax=Nocardia TaxID=1817 RepID=UPI0004C2E07E|nr:MULTISPECIES: DUF3073 domain-containing protein [Nocardia]MBF6144630.1 DUF3073 domain-containing protein [Nocardia nova]MDN2498956.1 DUF3073 domain-containing protein [Nocardia nova]